MRIISFLELQSISNSLKLEVLGVTSAENLQAEAENLRSWQNNKYHGDMNFMARDSNLFTNPANLLPNAKSLIIFALPYSSIAKPNLKPNTGRIAKYAWGKDYHFVAKILLKEIAQKLKESIGEDFSYRIFSDAVPILERAFAKNAGLGFIGKNTLLIRPGVGSFFFIAEIITNVEVVNLPILPKFTGCSTCTQCQIACPTNAFIEPYKLDARKCISYLTIEKRGFLNKQESNAIGEWLFGCDICQDVCPFNYAALHINEKDNLTKIKSKNISLIADFHKTNGIGPLINLSEVLNLKTNSQYEKKFSETAILRARRKNLLRNAACVAVNTNSFELIPLLYEKSLTDSAIEVVWHCLVAAIELEEKFSSFTSAINNKNNYKDYLYKLKDKLKEIPTHLLEEQIKIANYLI